MHKVTHTHGFISACKSKVSRMDFSDLLKMAGDNIVDCDDADLATEDGKAIVHDRCVAYLQAKAKGELVKGRDYMGRNFVAQATHGLQKVILLASMETEMLEITLEE